MIYLSTTKGDKVVKLIVKFRQGKDLESVSTTRENAVGLASELLRDDEVISVLVEKV